MIHSGENWLLDGGEGNFRAPMVRIGRRLLVGFHAETLKKELGAH
jgi:hypothetical protein